MIHDEDALALLRARFADSVTGPHTRDGATDRSEPWLEVAAARLVEVAKFLRDDPRTGFDFLNSVTAIDFLATDKRVADLVGEERLEVVYHLSSVARSRRLVLKTRLPRVLVGGELPELPSVAAVWKTADWHEREAYDLYGVRFVGHPNLQRILCAEDWVGHPLRKDYAIPLEYDGIRGR